VATDLHPTPTPASAAAQQGAAPASQGTGSGARRFLARLWAALGKVFPFRAKTRRVPVVHEDVVLTPEGAKLWEQVTDPNSPVGKPTHRRRRLPEGDAPR